LHLAVALHGRCTQLAALGMGPALN
jgi:hypothetical protein